MFSGILLLSSFKNKDKKSSKSGNGSFTLFYVDKSRTNGYASINDEMLEKLNNLIEESESNKSAELTAYFSDGDRGKFIKKASSIKSSIQSYSSRYTVSPSTTQDLKLLQKNVLSQDFSDASSINIYFFVSEYFAKDDLMGENSGILTNLFTKEIQSISKCADEHVSVTVFYPKDSKSFDIIEYQKKYDNLVSKEAKFNVKFISL